MIAANSVLAKKTFENRLCPRSRHRGKCSMASKGQGIERGWLKRACNRDSAQVDASHCFGTTKVAGSDRKGRTKIETAAARKPGQAPQYLSVLSVSAQALSRLRTSQSMHHQSSTREANQASRRTRANRCTAGKNEATRGKEIVCTHVAASRASAGMNPTESEGTCGREGILDGRERHMPELASVPRCGLGRVCLLNKTLAPTDADPQVTARRFLASEKFS
jgi:hypothetical protein